MVTGGPVIRVGTAGWTVPRTVAEAFPVEGTGLERYAARFNCAEINSTFYRPHRASTFERWASSTPEDFRFSVKIPRSITHEAKLRDSAALFSAFLEQLAPLGPKLGPLLVQLPPSLAFDAEVAAAFFAEVRAAFEGPVACEPRHATWFEADAADLLARRHIARVAADPARVPEAARPGGWPGLVYHRLHGSPRLYYSAYEDHVLDALAADLRGATAEAWCVFDNTVSGAAATNALDLVKRLSA